MTDWVKRAGEKSSRDGTESDFRYPAAPSALQHIGPKLCAGDMQKFHKTGLKSSLLESQAFSLHRTVNGTKGRPNRLSR
jgi:hypothetical protein